MTKNKKLIVWLVMVGILSGLFWWDAKIWLQGSLFDSSNYKPSLVVLLVILAGFISVGFMLFQVYWSSIVAGVLLGTGYIDFFGINPVNIVTAALILLLFFHSHASTVEELTQRTKINAKMALKRGVSPLLLAIFLLLSFGAYQSPAIKSFENLKQLPTSTEEFIRGIVNAAVGAQIKEASPGNINQMLNQVTREVTAQINSIARPYFTYLPPVLAFGLFITLWSLIWLFAWLSLLVGMAVFFLWKRIGWFKIEEKDVKAEVLVV